MVLRSCAFIRLNVVLSLMFVSCVMEMVGKLPESVCVCHFLLICIYAMNFLGSNKGCSKKYIFKILTLFQYKRISHYQMFWPKCQITTKLTNDRPSRRL